MTAQDTSRFEDLKARCASWNAASLARPGDRVRVYTANEDGTVSSVDRERAQVCLVVKADV